MILFIIIGYVSGIISGMGIGGGAILIPALSFLCGIEQQQAQSINLLYFLPTAAIALVTHKKKGNIETKHLKKLILFGILGACAGSFIALKTSPAILRKMFGFFLLAMGIYEFIRKDDAS